MPSVFGIARAKKAVFLDRSVAQGGLIGSRQALIWKIQHAEEQMSFVKSCALQGRTTTTMHNRQPVKTRERMVRLSQGAVNKATSCTPRATTHIRGTALTSSSAHNPLFLCVGFMPKERRTRVLGRCCACSNLCRCAVSAPILRFFASSSFLGMMKLRTSIPATSLAPRHDTLPCDSSSTSRGSERTPSLLSAMRGAHLFVSDRERVCSPWVGRGCSPAESRTG